MLLWQRSGNGGGLLGAVPVYQEDGEGVHDQGTEEVPGVAEAVHYRLPAASDRRDSAKDAAQCRMSCWQS